MYLRASLEKLSLVALFTLAVAACSDDDPIGDQNTANSEPLTAVEVCGLNLASGISQDNGVGALCWQYFSFSAEDITEEQLSYFCRTGSDARVWADKLLASLDAGRISIDWAVARTCLDEARALRSTGPQRTLYGARKAEWDAVKDGPCKTFYAGAVADGAECVDDWDCGEGRGCYTDDPFTPGSQRCMTTGAAGDACDGDWHPCGEGFECSDTGTCAALAGSGSPCGDSFECASGYCDAASGMCAAAPAMTSLGQPCTTPEECGSECVSCRPAASGAGDTCELLGGEGDYCRDWNDCAWDLGCTNSICTAVGQGQVCGGLQQTICQAGFTCADSPNCGSAADQGACEGFPECAWSADYSACFGGTCEVAPTSGNCVAGYLCDATVAVCVGTATPTCQPFAVENASCDDNLVDYPSCALGLTCLGGTCLRVCELDADCADGQFCDGSGSRPTCVAYDGTCESDLECPADRYCDNCDLPGDEPTCAANSGCGWTEVGSCGNNTTCSGNSDQPACEGDANCQWAPGCVFADVDGCSGFADQGTCDPVTGCTWFTEFSQCGPTCWQFDNDQIACEGEAIGCSFDAGLGYCDPNCASLMDQGSCEDPNYACAWSGSCEDRIDCTDTMTYPDESTCIAMPACAWSIDDAYCEATANGKAFACGVKGDIGDACMGDSTCSSAWCDSDDTGASRCAYEPTGCNTENEAPFLRLTFLFGGVWALRGARRRRRKR